tara:strand:- start:1205 stop:1405 length:201 start_codon:yes stop_codon:yes gene_type:complete
MVFFILFLKLLSKVRLISICQNETDSPPLFSSNRRTEAYIFNILNVLVRCEIFENYHLPYILSVKK